MMAAGGKGHARRRENTALVEANWPFPDRRKQEGSYGVQDLHGHALPPSQEVGVGQVSTPIPGNATEARG